MDTLPPPHRRMVLAAIWVCFAITLACLAYPIYVIRPFRAQGARELTAALAVLQFRGIVTAIAAVVVIAAAIAYWRLQRRTWRRIGVIAVAFASFAFAGLCRVNVYEQMFHPNSRPGFVNAQQAGLDRDEMVIAVREGSVARAYPIRSMAYHHVVNDVVGGVPIAPTY